MSAWNQNVCTDCWVGQNGTIQEDGGIAIRVPTRVHLEMPFNPVRCSFCGRLTTSGIYVRADPKKVPYPAPVED